jgi:tRNA nucleotidyltransferase (CCA-adding enzyme)
MIIKLPGEVQFIIGTLENRGYGAYAVGGCVRDSLLGKEPQDWDICTSALPEQTMGCFDGYHIIETGMKHGTITLMLNHQPFEITTYRVDGKYTDGRRPDSVKFVSVLKRDLARRDFTIGAMAYNPKTGLVDYYGGQQDLANGTIKCVGNPDKRFQEDALRIMRALRFAAVFGFTIDTDTARAMHNNRTLLKNIAAERIAVELNKLLMGDRVSEVLSAHISVLTGIIPEFEPAVGFGQNNPYHCYDVMTHTLASIDAAPKDLIIRLTMLFHDIGKPSSYTESADGVGHFYGHPQVGTDMARDILARLKYDNDTIKAVTQLVLYHDTDVRASRKIIKRSLSKLGEERFRQLIEVKRADTLAHSESVRAEGLSLLDDVMVVLDEIIEQQQCFSLKDLAVNGRDLIDAGVTEGVQIGKILSRLLDMVINESIENDKVALKHWIALLRDT